MTLKAGDKVLVLKPSANQTSWDQSDQSELCQWNRLVIVPGFLLVQVVTVWVRDLLIACQQWRKASTAFSSSAQVAVVFTFCVEEKMQILLWKNAQLGVLVLLLNSSKSKKIQVLKSTSLQEKKSVSPEESRVRGHTFLIRFSHVGSGSFWNIQGLLWSWINLVFPLL